MKTGDLQIKFLLFAIVWVAFHALANAADTAPTPRPNIVFILCDDLGYGDIGVFYQNQRAALNDRSVPFFTTPHIDTLARDGMKLTQHYCAAPVCAPSRASLLTGRTQGSANVRDNQFDKALADTNTLGSVLHQAGYATAAIGKWGLQGKPSETAGDDVEHAPGGVMPAYWNGYPTKRGFDFYYGYIRHKDGHFHYPHEDKREVWENDQLVPDDLDLCYTTDLFTARAKKWIEQQAGAHPDQPFFLYLAYDTPHAKLQLPPCAYPAGGGLTGGVQWTGKPGSMLNTAQGKMDGWMYPEIERATWDHDHDPATPEVPWPDVQKRHATDVRRIDDCVGDLLQLLADLKIDRNTLVVFTSDNGPSIESYLKEDYRPTFFRGFGPFDGIKRDTLEGGEREPTLARWPAAIRAGSEDKHPSGQWDWLATFAELAGVPAPASTDGVSLVPSLTGRGEQRSSTLYVEYFNNAKTPSFAEFAPAHRGRKRDQMQSIYLDGYKGIRYGVKSAEDDFEIYDLAKDPQEANNLAATPGMAELQAKMKARALQVRTVNKNAPRPYDNALVPPVEIEPSTEPGLSWSLFKGTWPWLPAFRSLRPDARGTLKTAGLSFAEASQPFGALFEGFFHAPADGDYQFTIAADSSPLLFVHDIRVIDESTADAAGNFTGSVKLKAGWHPFRLAYRHAVGTPKLEWTCTFPDGQSENLDAAVLRQAGNK